MAWLEMLWWSSLTLLLAFSRCSAGHPRTCPINCSLYNRPRVGVRETGAALRAVRGDTADKDERDEGAGEGRRGPSSCVGVGGEVGET